ncbi:MAG: NAD(P)-dependent oxidoreductase, partial [Alphaproteobacteria bacterium]
MSVVAFLGLGAIGLPMAINLCRAGHTVVAYDMRPERVALMQAEGAKPAATLREAVRAADTVISVLPGGKDHREIYLGADGILAQARTGMLVIDSSTSQIELAREIAAHAGRLAIDAIDAPISGGIRGAKAGKLTFMAGGSAKAIERARPILMGMAQAVIHTGDAGTGQAAKICNNLMVGINTLGMCEAFALAEKIGLDAGTLFDVPKHTTG